MTLCSNIRYPGNRKVSGVFLFLMKSMAGKCVRRERESSDHYIIMQKPSNNIRQNESLLEVFEQLQRQQEKLELIEQVYGLVVNIDMTKLDDLFGNIKNSLNKTVF